MSSTDCYSLESSAGCSSDSECLPRSRIKFSRNQIIVGDNSFRSASDALLVYLKQYDVSVGKEVRIKGQGYAGDGRGPPQLDQYLASNSHDISAQSLAGINRLVGGGSFNLSGATEDVESLLISQMSSSQLREEVADAFREIKLRRLLKHAALKPQSQTKTDLQREVEAALLRSAQLLEKVSKEDMSFTSILTSDINNCSTKTLGNYSTALDVSEIGKKQSGHIYSYRTSNHHQKPAVKHSPSKFLHIPASYGIHQQTRELRRSASIDNLLPVSHKLPPRGKHSFSSSSTSPSYQSDPTDVLKRVRSRSVSPGLRNLASSLTASGWVEQLDQSVRKSVPSWVGDLTPSEVSDSLWNSKSLQEARNDKMSYEIPSWVGEAENSKLGEDSNYFCESEPLIPRMSWSPGSVKGKDNYNSVISNDLNSNSSVTTDSRPGLKFSDLALSDIACPGNSKHTPLSTARKGSSSVEKYKPKHSTPNQTNHSVTHSDTFTHPQHSRMLDSEYTGQAFLHKNILPQTAKLKKSMDKFAASSENLRHRSLSSDLSVTSSSPRCSSLDTLSLLAGQPLLRTETSAANDGPKDNTVVQDRSPSPTSSGQDLYSSDGLDGDRSWEQVTGTFKPPVPVNSEDLPGRNGVSPERTVERTLSGRKQPGSMETLKNMLFKLQAEENSTQEGSKNEEASYFNHKNHSQAYVDILPALQNYDFVKEPGGQSLEKALVHLNRLKKLVQSTATPTSNDETVKIAFTSEHSKKDLEQEGS